MVGKKIQVFGKSPHAGQTGVVVADYGSHLFIKADDETYAKAFNSSGRVGKYFQVDRLLCKQLKD